MHEVLCTILVNHVFSVEYFVICICMCIKNGLLHCMFFVTIGSLITVFSTWGFFKLHLVMWGCCYLTAGTDLSWWSKRYFNILVCLVGYSRTQPCMSLLMYWIAARLVALAGALTLSILPMLDEAKSRATNLVIMLSPMYVYGLDRVPDYTQAYRDDPAMFNIREEYREAVLHSARLLGYFPSMLNTTGTTWDI